MKKQPYERYIPMNFTGTSQKKKNYYTLSFEYTFHYDDDEVYFAYSIPYTYSQLLNFLKESS